MIKKVVSEAKQRVADTGRLPKGGLAAPVAMAALAALSLAGCGNTGRTGRATRYDGKTEASLRGKIRPVMVDIAKGVLRLHARYPDAVTIEAAGKNIGKNIVDVHVNGANPEFSTSDPFYVVMRTNRRGIPVPSTVMSVSLAKDNNPGRLIDDSIKLASPDGSRHGYGGLVEPNPHPDGWTSEEHGTIDLGEGVNNPSFVYGSSDPTEFATDDDGNILGPIRTSGIIAADARDLYAGISVAIVHYQQHEQL